MHIPPKELYDSEYNSSYQNKKHQSNKIYVYTKAKGNITENSIHKMQIKISVQQLVEIRRNYV